MQIYMSIIFSFYINFLGWREKLFLGGLSLPKWFIGNTGGGLIIPGSMLRAGKSGNKKYPALGNPGRLSDHHF